jgi:hypothetical protein
VKHMFLTPPEHGSNGSVIDDAPSVPNLYQIRGPRLDRAQKNGLPDISGRPFRPCGQWRRRESKAGPVNVRERQRMSMGTVDVL